MIEDIILWRIEIDGDISQAESELEAAVEDVRAAEAARDLAAAEHLSIWRVLSDLAALRPDQSIFGLGITPLPASLQRKLDPTGRALHVAEGRLTRAKLAVENLTYRIGDLREALTELDRASDEERA